MPHSFSVFCFDITSCVVGEDHPSGIQNDVPTCPAERLSSDREVLEFTMSCRAGSEIQPASEGPSNESLILRTTVYTGATGIQDQQPRPDVEPTGSTPSLSRISLVPLRSCGMSDLEATQRVSFSQQVGRVSIKSNPDRHIDCAEEARSQYLERNRAANSSVVDRESVAPRLEAEGQISPRRDNAHETSVLTPEKNSTRRHQTGLRLPPPPPLEYWSVQGPCTTPGAISIRPRPQPPTDRPVIAASASRQLNSTRRASRILDEGGPVSEPNNSPLSQVRFPENEILIEAPLVEEDTTTTPEAPPRPTRTTFAPMLGTPTTTKSSNGPAFHGAIQIVRAKTVGFAELSDHEGFCEQRNFYSSFNRNRIILLAISALLGVIGLVLGLGPRDSAGLVPTPISTGNSSRPTNTSAPNETQPQLSTLEIFIQVELPQYSQDALANKRLPQSKAIAFLQQDPLLESYTKNRRLTRFALGVLYYSLHCDFGNHTWNVATRWVSNASECTWYSTWKNGSICTPEGHFNNLAL
jgi:hypothetical protein